MVSWGVKKRETATNHRRLTTIISTDIQASTPKYTVRYKDLNVLKLQKALSEEIGGMTLTLLEGKSVDECVSFLTEKLQCLCGEQTRGRKVRRKAEPSWVPQLLNERKHVLTQEGGTDYEIMFRKIRSKFRRSVRRAKWEHYRKILEEVEPGRPFGLHFE